MISIEEELTSGAVRNLMDGKNSIICIRNFLEPDECTRIADQLRSQQFWEGTSYSDIYDSAQIPLYAVSTGRVRLEEYLERVPTMQKFSRDFFADGLTPFERLQGLLEQCWDAGANILRLHGLPTFFGLIRRWRQGMEALPHVDNLLDEFDASVVGDVLTAQFGVNLYLAVSPSGGALEVWENQPSLSSTETINYGIDRKKLGKPDQQFTPQVGDLVLVNTLNPHAVTEVLDGERLTVSGFIGVSAIHERLLLWS